ncbi:nucleotidyltransferase family protein [Tsuneonella sp. HG222]
MTGGLLIAVLAAGRGERFGGAKLDAECAGKPLGRWALDAALETGSEVALVVGAAAPAFAVGTATITNPEAHEGLGTSVAAAARWAIERRAGALLLTLADMPLVTAATLRDLAEGSLPAAVRYPSGRPGVPACFPASMLSALAACVADSGAGALLAAQSGLRLVEATAQELRDVDRPGDLADIAAILQARVRP